MELTPSIIIIKSQQLDSRRMFIKNQQIKLSFGLTGWLFIATFAFGHDPIFSPGPHVLFKDGFEIHAEFAQSEQGVEGQKEQAVALKYGLSGDWVVGIEYRMRSLRTS